VNNKYTVYMHVNKINGKVYIGITGSKTVTRWRGGERYKTQDHFCRAIAKYGWLQFEHLILFSNLTADDAENKERELIENHKSIHPEFGYNKTSGGGVNRFVSEETRYKMRLANTGVNNNQYGKKCSAETRKKMSLSRIGSNNPNYGKITPAKTRNKISLSLMGSSHSKETRENMSLTRMGKNNPNARKIICLTTGIEFLAISEASGQYGINRSCIKDCCTGKQKTAGGYSWAYAN
jgi:group I intron endonuclease